ncbi:MAG: PAS domain S-box protein [Candidatus Omnitrophota bacterium]
MIWLIVSNLITLLIAVYLAVSISRRMEGCRIARRLLESLNIGYCRLRRRDGVILAANNGFAGMLELDISEKNITGRSLSELIIYAEDEEKIRELVKSKGELRDYEYHYKTLKGKDKCARYNAFLGKSPGGEDIIEILVEDMTEEKTAYEKMRGSQERYEKLFRNSGDMVIICGLSNFIIEEVNPITEVITGFSAGELAGKPFSGLFHPSHRKGLLGIQRDLLFKGASRWETVMVCKNGTYKEAIMTLSLVEIDDDRVVMAVGKDVTALFGEREEQARRQKEMEDFWKAAVKREERMKDLRQELERTKQQIRIMEEKNGTRNKP